ncbi:hypothetical protein [Halarchaeum nitratireducens]|uniref:DUF1102 domain-containing protein n=1 Tax=Halarchaeum nitratireducens TaxID=489913 RepID=A0A830GEV7_9EURY|nr:hypothetical protein [Halarchaeum nitratireducens]GGN22759.1 hypothetical protein GCM10009021_25440 [Halarchaeum nitratireducens]
MKRRTLIAGLGSLTASGVFAVGSGAFTSVSAKRTVSISVANDSTAFLKLNEQGNGRRSYTDGGTIGFDIPGPGEDDYGGTDPEGLGTDSVYRFGGDADNAEQGLFAAENQGTQPVKLYSTQAETDGVPTVTMYDVDTGNLLTEESPSDPMDVGNQLRCGLEIDTHGVPVREDEYDVTLTIHADATAD